MSARTSCVALAVLIALVCMAGASWAGDNVRYENERMYVDGEPFFYWGFIWRYPHIPLEMMKEYGFNAADASHRPSAEEEYDRAQELGIHLMDSITQEWVPQHPAFIAWFLLDDASGEEDLQKVKERVAARREIDNNHPTLVDLNSRTVEGDLPFVDVIDIYAPYAYPLPTQGYEWYFYDFLDALREGVDRKYMWSAYQCSGIYSKHARLGFTGRDMHMFPTAGQFRLLCWGGIAHGIRGFMFWPISGLLPPEDDNGDRTAEAMIISKELEILGDDIIVGREVRDGATADLDNIDIGRVDLPTHTILIASVLGEGYEFAMDEATATATIRMDRPEELDGDIEAYTFDFGGCEDIAVTEKEDALILEQVPVDVTQVIVVEGDSGPRGRYEAGLTARLPQAAENSQMLLEYLHAKMAYVHNRLRALAVEVDAAQAAFERAVELKSDSAAAFETGDNARAYTLARQAQQNYRRMLYEYRAYAETLRADAPPRAGKFLMMPYTLPRFFASFDHTQVAQDE